MSSRTASRSSRGSSPAPCPLRRGHRCARTQAGSVQLHGRRRRRCGLVDGPLRGQQAQHRARRAAHRRQRNGPVPRAGLGGDDASEPARPALASAPSGYSATGSTCGCGGSIGKPAVSLRPSSFHSSHGLLRPAGRRLDQCPPRRPRPARGSDDERDHGHHSHGRGTSGVAVGAGAVWVTSTIDGTVARIDPRTAEVVDEIDVGGRPREVAVARAESG